VLKPTATTIRSSTAAVMMMMRPVKIQACGVPGGGLP
jgi:hypothetical protein